MEAPDPWRDQQLRSLLQSNGVRVALQWPLHTSAVGRKSKKLGKRRVEQLNRQKDESTAAATCMAASHNNRLLAVAYSLRTFQSSVSAPHTSGGSRSSASSASPASAPGASPERRMSDLIPVVAIYDSFASSALVRFLACPASLLSAAPDMSLSTACWSSDSHFFFAGTFSGRILCWRVESGELIHSFEVAKAAQARARAPAP